MAWGDLDYAALKNLVEEAARAADALERIAKAQERLMTDKDLPPMVQESFEWNGIPHKYTAQMTETEHTVRFSGLLWRKQSSLHEWEHVYSLHEEMEKTVPVTLNVDYYNKWFHRRVRDLLAKQDAKTSAPVQTKSKEQQT